MNNNKKKSFQKKNYFFLANNIQCRRDFFSSFWQVDFLRKKICLLLMLISYCHCAVERKVQHNLANKSIFQELVICIEAYLQELQLRIYFIN